MAVYIKITGIYNKFKQAEKENRVLFISAPCGYGKSAAFSYYYRRKPYLQISGRNGSLDKMPLIDSIRQSVVLVDDICLVTDEKSRQYVLDMIYYGQKTVVLMGRGALPVWLVKADTELEFIRADKESLKFTATETKAYMEKMGYYCSMEMVEILTDKLIGYPLLIMFYIKNLGAEVEYSSDVFYRAVRELYHYYDEALWNVWNKELGQALLVSCEFETYTVELIERITGMKKLAELIEYAYNIGNFICYLGNGNYQINSLVREYILWKRSFVYSNQDMKKIYQTAAEYFEEKDDVERALHYYSKAKMDDQISRLLIEKTECDPARAQLFRSRNYLLALKEEQIRENPALIASISILYSVLFSPEQSEKWYHILLTYLQDQARTEQQKKEAKARLVFLDMSLMHRIPAMRIESLYHAAEMVKTDNIKIPEMAVTGNSPSVINGGVDFSFFLKRGKKDILEIREAVFKVFGRFGKSLYKVGIAESMLEQNTGNVFEMIRLLNEAYAAADVMNRMEICFTAVVLLTRWYLIKGQITIALDQMKNFYQKIKKENAFFLLPNMKAFYAWISLLQGDMVAAKEWLKEAPDENKEFYITERYRYMHKLRIMIAAGDMERAYSLIKRLNLFLVEYHREYYWIQNKVLEAILLYRLGNIKWEEILLDAIEKARSYHYVRVIADEGTAIVPLLNKLKKGVRNTDFVKEVISEADKMAKKYPDYMELEYRLTEPLTKKEMEILHLMYNGKKTEEICQLCNISYSGLKFHNRNIYRKLGVSNRQEAERKAALLRIVY